MSALSAGARLGPYEISELIGAGGMGEVYKATDTRLERTVAIKVLPPHWAEDPMMKQRFEREARTIASLNHPHICILYDIGRERPQNAGVEDAAIDFLVMEYLEGETVAARLERGPLGLEEALSAAIAIGDALDKAHGRGVVHRDLKPSNVMLSESGPKLLDFGLAKWKPSSKSPSASMAPTRSDMTTPGAIIGTLQYMAPEQLEGVDADARTDIFAFGVLVYEMVTGRKAFQGKSQVLLMSAIAASEPEDLSKTQPAAPPALEHVVKTCLAKDPKDRWQSARDLLAELRWIADGGGAAGGAPIPETRRKRATLERAVLAAGAVLLLPMAIAAAFYVRGPQEPSEFRFRIPFQLTAQATVANGTSTANNAVSPDGKSIVFSARAAADNGVTLYVRPIASVTPQRLAGTEGATQPFWSPDSRSIAFVQSGRLKKIEASGGPAQDIDEAPDFYGGAWTTGDTIVFGSAAGLFRVSAQGGKKTPLTKIEAPETGHFWPSFLPDGRHFLYLAWSAEPSKRAIYAGTLDGNEKKMVMAAESGGWYAQPGYLLFHREDAIYARRFDVKKLEVSGEPVRLADEVVYDPSTGRSSFFVSPVGVLVYLHVNGLNINAGANVGVLQLAWIKRDSNDQPEQVGSPDAYRGVDVSPDGKRIAVHRHDGTGGDIYVIEPPEPGMVQSAQTRITNDAARDNSSPIWSPDGSQLVYAAQQKGKWGLYRNLSNSSGTEEPLYESEYPLAPMSWVGKTIVFWVQNPKTSGDLWVLSLEGDKKAVAFIEDASNETHAQISPDGKWIAFTSDKDKTTKRNEIYVRPFPSGSGEFQISTGGGDWPRWRKDGKELFFHTIGGNNNPSVRLTGTFVGALLSCTVNANGSVFACGPPKELVGLLAINIPHPGGDYHMYAVSPSGRQFLYLTIAAPNNAPAAAGNAPAGPDPQVGLVVALNWASSLKK